MKDKLSRNDRVQVWDEKEIVCLGWGTVIEIARPATDINKLTVFVLLDNKGKAFSKTGVVWGDRYDFIPEKKAIEIAKQIEKDLENIK